MVLQSEITLIFYIYLCQIAPSVFDCVPEIALKKTTPPPIPSLKRYKKINKTVDDYL